MKQTLDAVKIHQTRYCEEILERYQFQDAHPSSIPMETNMRLSVKETDKDRRKQAPASGKKFPYRELVGSLLYMTTCTRDDLAYCVGQLSRYVQNPTQQHIGAPKRVLRFLIGTKSKGIVYSRNKMMSQEPSLILGGYCDSDWGNDPDTRKIKYHRLFTLPRSRCNFMGFPATEHRSSVDSGGRICCSMCGMHGRASSQKHADTSLPQDSDYFSYGN